MDGRKSIKEYSQIIKFKVSLILLLCTFFLFFFFFPHKKPNVILITIDSLRANHLECWGYFRNTSPNICTLAKDSLVFLKAFSHYVSTDGSIPSLLTSKYGSEIGALNFEYVLNETTFIDILKENGWEVRIYSEHPWFQHLLKYKE